VYVYYQTTDANYHADQVESALNISIANALGTLLHSSPYNANVSYTRTTENGTGIALDARGPYANTIAQEIKTNGHTDYHRSVFVSIHCNSLFDSPDLNRNGTMDTYEQRFIIGSTYIDGTTVNNHQLAIIRNSNREYYRPEEKLATLLGGVNYRNLTVLINTNAPAVLFETGFISREDIQSYLSSEAGRQAVAQQTANAIVQYYTPPRVS
ncbi:MAG: N-acetylmuramoyl-L-alanine amidase, partial [bacterium]